MFGRLRGRGGATLAVLGGEVAAINGSTGTSNECFLARYSVVIGGFGTFGTEEDSVLADVAATIEADLAGESRCAHSGTHNVGGLRGSERSSSPTSNPVCNTRAGVVPGVVSFFLLLPSCSPSLKAPLATVGAGAFPCCCVNEEEEEAAVLSRGSKRLFGIRGMS